MFIKLKHQYLDLCLLKDKKYGYGNTYTCSISYPNDPLSIHHRLDTSQTIEDNFRKLRREKIIQIIPVKLGSYEE